MHKVLPLGMLDTLSQTIDKVRLGLGDGLQIVIRAHELIILRIIRIGIERRKDRMHIHNHRAGPFTIVQPRNRDR